MKQYDDNQYYEQGDAELGTGFTNYERLLLELNYKNYYPNKTTAEMTGNKDYEGLKSDRIRVYEKILNECGLDPEANYDKNTDHAKLLEAAYTILHSLWRICKFNTTVVLSLSRPLLIVPHMG